MGSSVGLLPPQSDTSDVMKGRNFLKQMRKYQLLKGTVQL